MLARVLRLYTAMLQQYAMQYIHDELHWCAYFYEYFYFLLFRFGSDLS